MLMVALLLLLALSQSYKIINIPDPETLMNATQIIKVRGYSVSEERVHTKDGYILTLQRIQPRKYLPMKKVVLLQHGLLDSAHTWINNPNDQSLAFIMADYGYEVWLSNSRGNTYSRSHEKYTTADSEFWQFSWDEMAQYDLPAMIDYITSRSQVESIYYVGHSQGTEIFFAFFNDHPEYSHKVRAMAALAPVAYIGHVKSPIRIIAPLCRSYEFVDFFGVNEFLPSMELIKFLSAYVCPKEPVYEFCSNIVYLLSGYDEPNTNKTRLPIYLSHTPAGTSVQNMIHYCQASWLDEFQKLDFGASLNLKKYGSLVPPKYGLERIKVPTALFSGGQDWLSSPQDVKHLKSLHGSIVDKYSLFIDYYNHLDFVWGMDAKEKVYPTLLEFFHEYSE